MTSLFLLLRHFRNCGLFNVRMRLGWRTGFITNTRITHGTPAAIFAHVPDRRFEFNVPPTISHAHRCKDIARQLVEDSNFNVSLSLSIYIYMIYIIYIYTELGTILEKCIIDTITITHFFLIIDTTTII